MNNPKPVVMLLADGSRRWAREQGKSLAEGYEACGVLLASMFDHIYDQQSVSSLYVVVCTANNLTDRPAEEVAGYLDAFLSGITKATRPIYLDVVGDLSLIPLDGYAQRYNNLKEKHQDSNGLKITYTVGWSSDVEVLDIARKAVAHPPKTMDDVRAMSIIKEPMDLVIRTGKVQRVSGMLPLFSPYAEIRFVDDYFPDVTPEAIDKIIEDYRSTERRFGGQSPTN